MFPVAEAELARKLGFTAEELKRLTIPISDVYFEQVPLHKQFLEDSENYKGKYHNGPHSTGKIRVNNQSSAASSNFHKILVSKLKGANTKKEAENIIKEIHEQYVKGYKCKGDR